MELTAAIVALKQLKEPCEIYFCSDSKYLSMGLSEWLEGWKARGWRTAAKKPVQNTDLWRELDALQQGHVIKWKWVRGHTGHYENERCDELANMAIDEMRYNS